MTSIIARGGEGDRASMPYQCINPCMRELHHHHSTFKEGNVKRSLILLLIMSLVVPVLFLGCSGDDGSTGAAGAPGGPGGPGAPGAPGPGVLANETCAIRHGGG